MTCGLEIFSTPKFNTMNTLYATSQKEMNEKLNLHKTTFINSIKIIMRSPIHFLKTFTILIFILFSSIFSRVTAQENVGIGTTSPHPSAKLDIVSTDAGILIPRMTLAEAEAISGPETGLMVYLNDLNGFYYYNGVGWEKIAGTITILEDTDKDTRVLVEKGMDDDTIRFEMGGLEYFKMANGRLEVLNTGESIFIGRGSGVNDDLTGNQNVFIGDSTGNNNISGSYNIALGYGALYSNTNGNSNIAIGEGALERNESSASNIAIGPRALFNHKIGLYNTVLGYNAMFNDIEGSGNTAIGRAALFLSTASKNNSAVGATALNNNISGSENVAFGTAAGYNTQGDGNIFLGSNAGYFETGGNTLYIENSDADSTGALIYGEFDNDWLRINGRLSPMQGITDADGDTRIHLEKNIDDDSIRFQTGGTEFFTMAHGRLAVLNTGNSVFIGEGAGAIDDLTDNFNVFIGSSAGSQNTSGSGNSASGYQSLLKNTTGSYNIGNGFQTLYSNTEGSFNIANGREALFSNTIGENNIANGYAALYFNSQGSNNIAHGIQALFSNTIGENNIASGHQSLLNNSAGSYNVASGYQSGWNSLGDSSIFIGNQAGYFETSGHRLYIENSDADASGALIYGEFDNDILSFNANVGIGTQAPLASLHVYDGDARIDRGTNQNVERKLTLGGARNGGSNPYATIEFSNLDNNGSVVDYVGASIKSYNATGDDSGDLRFYTTSADLTPSEKMIISPIGRVGIGNSSPSEKLHISGGNLLVDRGSEDANLAREITLIGARNSSSSPYATINFNNFDNDNGMVDYSGARISSHNGTAEDSGDLRFFTTPSSGSLTQRMKIDTDGNVGIGTTSPSARLNVSNGNLRVDRGSSNNNTTRILEIGGAQSGFINPFAQIDFLNFDQGDSGTDYTAASIRSNNAGAIVSGDLSFWTTPTSGVLTEVMTIDEDGKVGLNKTNPSVRLDIVDNNIIGAVAKIDNTAMNENSVGLIIECGSIVNPLNDFIQFLDGSGDLIGRLAGNGVNGIQLYTNSDLRLKDNIHLFSAGLDLINALRPVKYEMITNPGKEEIGFIAQEMYEIFPQAVSGTPDQDISDPMGVDYSRLTPVLVSAIKEQQEIIEGQDKKIENLQEQIDELREMITDHLNKKK